MSLASTKKPSSERLDWHAMKDRVSLEAVAVALLGEASGRRGERGLWWACPLHSDRNPSFKVDPERGRWKCFGCGEHGDAVSLVRKLDGATFPEAVRRVAELTGLATWDGGARPSIVPRPAKAVERPPERSSGLPAADALSLVTEAAERLWTREGESALSYLHNRGLNDETIRAARLGYTPGAAIPTKSGDRCYRAAGVVIPWVDRKRLVMVKIRQPEGARPKYVEAFRDPPVRAFPSLAAIRSGRPLIVAEGEFDALLLDQQLHDAASVVTLGSASARRDDPSVRIAMLAAPVLFIATDADTAGDKAAVGWPRPAIRVRPPEGCNDWTDVHASGRNRIRFIWGRYLPISTTWEELSDWRWGAALDDDEPAND